MPASLEDFAATAASGVAAAVAAAEEAAASAARACKAAAEATIAFAEALRKHNREDGGEAPPEGDSSCKICAATPTPKRRSLDEPVAAADVMVLVAALDPSRSVRRRSGGGDRVRVGFALKHNEGLLMTAGRAAEAELMAPLYDMFCMRSPDTYPGRRATMSEYAASTRATAITMETLKAMADEDRATSAASAAARAKGDARETRDARGTSADAADAGNLRRARDLFDESGLTYSPESVKAEGGFRPDFVFDAATHFVVVEVNRSDCKATPADGERPRMLSLCRSLGRPTFFVRYNPGAYLPGGRAGSSQEPLASRERTLVTWLRRLISSSAMPRGAEALHLFFDGYAPADVQLDQLCGL